MRNSYLISYDVSDDKRRNSVFKTLMGNGDHVQFSVFVCQLNRMELARVKGQLAQTIHHRQDQVIILDLGPAGGEWVSHLQCLGKVYTPSARVNVI